jgi:uncharacterized protein (UPF0332 family)
VDYYINAEEQLESAKILANSEKYRIAVTLLCLSKLLKKDDVDN